MSKKRKAATLRPDLHDRLRTHVALDAAARNLQSALDAAVEAYLVRHERKRERKHAETCRVA